MTRHSDHDASRSRAMARASAEIAARLVVIALVAGAAVQSAAWSQSSEASDQSSGASDQSGGASDQSGEASGESSVGTPSDASQDFEPPLAWPADFDPGSLAGFSLDSDERKWGEGRGKSFWIPAI